MTYTASSLGARYWRARLGRWPVCATTRASDGYSVLVPVPGDLPVFLRIALAVVKHQQTEYRLGTLVVPDVLTRSMHKIVKEARADWPGPLRLQALPVPERWVLPRLNNPGRNHALQLITGTARVKTSHVVFHDADLFLMTPDVLDRQYLTCQKEGLACLGVSPVWDPWFAEHHKYLAATWELCARVDWLKSFVPALHMAHENELFGERHSFDTTLYPQAITDPELIGVQPSPDIVHFNYVISHYRHFLRNTNGRFKDNRFLLLLVRVLVDLFDASNSSEYHLPSLSDLGACLGREEAGVTFPFADGGVESYRHFRTLLERILSGPWAVADARQAAVEQLKVFDDFYMAGAPQGSKRPWARSEETVK
jgi:hypothetical protein